MLDFGEAWSSGWELGGKLGKLRSDIYISMFIDAY